jgi:hydroxymethylpyrimidine pyrophosphatase-like HAD family hydrolase
MRGAALAIPVWSDNFFLKASGTPFFSEIYKNATIVLTNGRILKDVKARINVYAHETEFISANGVEALMQKGTVQEVYYSDTTAEGILKHTFKTGFPPIDKQTGDNFYLVLANGRCSLLKSITKRVTENRNQLTGELRKDYETFEDYYFYTKGAMKRWKKDKDFVLEELSDKLAEINQFIQSNKINFRNTENIIRLLNYYNSL